MPSKPQTMLEPDDLVSTCSSRQAGISWPLPVDVKLEALLTSARSAGERTSRREIVAAIIAMHSNFTGVQLGELLRRYRLAKVGEVLETKKMSPDDSNILTFTPQGPGPRRLHG